MKKTDKHMEKIDKYTVGYLVEYSEKHMYPEPYGERTNAICSREELIVMLQKWCTYAVWRCNCIRVYDYLENHKDEEIELRGFEK